MNYNSWQFLAILQKFSPNSAALLDESAVAPTFQSAIEFKEGSIFFPERLPL